MFIKDTLITLIKLKEVLNKYDWTDEILKNSNDINEIFNIFLQTLGEIVDHHPLLNKVTKENLQLKPWISKKIKHLMCKRDNLFRKYCACKRQLSHEKFNI